MIEIKKSRYSHLDITTGVHTNGPENIFVRQTGGQWFIVTTKMSEVKVRTNLRRLGFERFVKVYCQAVLNNQQTTVAIFEHQDTGPIFGMKLPQYLPIPTGIKQSVPRNDELQRVRELVGDRTVAALEVALAVVEAVNVTGLALDYCIECKQLVVNLPNIPTAYCLKCAEKAKANVLAAGQI